MRLRLQQKISLLKGNIAQWVGQTSEVFLEVRTCNRRTGLVRQKGHRIFIIPEDSVSPQFDLADFLFTDKSQTTFLDWDEFPTKLNAQLRHYALSRCREWLRQSRIRAGLVGDES